MPLKMNKQTLLFRLHKAVHSSFLRLRQDRVATRLERFRTHFVPSRMRKTNRSRHIPTQRMSAVRWKFEDSEALVTQPIPLDPIAVKHAGVRRQARENGRDRVALG